MEKLKAAVSYVSSIIERVDISKDMLVVLIDKFKQFMKNFVFNCKSIEGIDEYEGVVYAKLLMVARLLERTKIQEIKMEDDFFEQLIQFCEISLRLSNEVSD